ncbi:MAG: HNH endonuclease signature motif containing protein [Syntrophales bacterium]
MENNTAAIEKIFLKLLAGKAMEASHLADREFPFEPAMPSERHYNPSQAMKVFVRDGFLDRYSGKQLLFPGILRLLSVTLPTAFPFQQHWKMSQTHIIFWQLFPTLDHVIPISRGEADDEGNLVCTSMLRNSAKANWTLDELGWQLHPPGNLGVWDGLTGLFLRFIEKEPNALSTSYLKSWHKAAISVLGRP